MSGKYEIHSIDCREGISKAQAESFLKKHNLKPIKEVHLTKHGNKIISRRYRIQDPALFKEFITKQIPTRTGVINLILGKREIQGTGLLDVGERVAQAIKGRPAGIYPPPVRKFIQDHHDEPITNVQVVRVPLSNKIMAGANLLTFGQLTQKMKEYNIDQLRHLYCVLRIGGHDYVTERNEIIVIKPMGQMKGQLIDLGPPRNQMTVGQLFQKLVDDDPNVTVYDAFSANCGHFAAKVVQTLGLTSNETTTFINQNIDGLVSTTYKKLAKGITDIAARGNVLLHGVGRKRVIHNRTGKSTCC